MPVEKAAKIGLALSPDFVISVALSRY